MEAITVKPLEQVEREAIEAALGIHRGNRTSAAKALGISVRTLQRKLKGYRLYQLRQLYRSESGWT